MYRNEQVPMSWDPERDECFFRVVARVLPASLVDGASTLLGTYDDEAIAPVPAGATHPAADDVRSRPRSSRPVAP
jgi:hypothetical protein